MGIRTQLAHAKLHLTSLSIMRTAPSKLTVTGNAATKDLDDLDDSDTLRFSDVSTSSAERNDAR